MAETGVGEGFDYLSFIILNFTEFNEYVALNKVKREKEEKRREREREREKLANVKGQTVVAENADSGAGLSARHGLAG